ncbi:hypothetical protein D915_005231 [Fasciola hepatica]|uniref:Kazrin N-terminal domain-containing protein n=1 Tax=Fasciola hepatica TaxID=6192 RepID=A0A4E0RSQ4_FASHE|nr:hypothetical protein D915_005231 [Fasciola hepatica]
MDSDESYETTSEVFREGESDQSSSSSQNSMNRDSSEIRDLYASTFSGPEQGTTHTMDKQIGSLTAKIKEQTIQIQSLKEERIKYLEQITQLYTALEKRESELVEFIQSYEQKANDVAQYMQEVQGLLSQLTTLFPDQLNESSTTEGSVAVFSTDAGSTTMTTTTGSNSLNNPNKTFAGTDTSLASELVAQQPQTSSLEPNALRGWDQRGRALLHALSASVATASARNKQGTLPRNTESPAGQIIAGSHLPIAEVPPRPVTRLTGVIVNGSKYGTKANFGTTTTKFTMASNESTTSDPTSSPEVTVCHLPPFCWSPAHVVYWLSEYACLPGGCVAAAERVQLDGKQLTALSGNKADKLLCLSDAGLRRKFQLALEDLRVHGPPGVSRFPGPSHVRPRWICDVWLRQHVGLSQLAPLFAVRRIDGRILASLAIYKRPGRTNPTTALASRNSRNQLISNPTELIIHPHPVSSLPGTPLPLPNGSRVQSGIAIDNRPDFDRSSGTWRGASRKEFHRILLGLSRDNSAVNSSNGGISGADLPPECKMFLGKREACSLRAGIELLRQYNFNLELLEEVRRETDTINDNLLLWTNQRVARWLKDIGLKAFTEGIDGTGLHGAYMVLDPTFDLARLMKHLHLPASVATAHKLDEHLQALLRPARQREGIIPKQYSIFRRRSISRPGRTSLMQRSITSVSPMDYSSASTPHLLTHPTHQDNNRALESNGAPFDSYPKTMPTNSSFIAALSTLNTNLSRTLNGNQPTGTPTKGSIGGTPKRGKFKSVTVTGDLSNSRLSKVFSRGRPTGQSLGHNPVSKEQISNSGTPLMDSKNGVTPQEERTSTLVRRSSAQPGTINAANAATSSKFSTPTTSPRHTTEPQKSTPYRAGVKPSEAPMVDPFAQSSGRTRMRIVLGQTPRVPTSPTAEGGNTSPFEAAVMTQLPALTDSKSPSPELLKPNSVSSPNIGPSAKSRTEPLNVSVPNDPVLNNSNTVISETTPNSTFSSLSLSTNSSTSLTHPLTDQKRVLS